MFDVCEFLADFMKGKSKIDQIQIFCISEEVVCARSCEHFLPMCAFIAF